MNVPEGTVRRKLWSAATAARVPAPARTRIAASTATTRTIRRYTTGTLSEAAGHGPPPATARQQGAEGVQLLDVQELGRAQERQPAERPTDEYLAQRPLPAWAHDRRHPLQPDHHAYRGHDRRHRGPNERPRGPGRVETADPSREEDAGEDRPGQVAERVGESQ